MGSLGWCIYQLTTENCKETANIDKKVENVDKFLYKFLLCEFELMYFYSNIILMGNIHYAC